MDVVAFSDFVFDRLKRQLRRGTEDLPLRARAMDLLEVLLSHRGGVVARDEVLEAVWPDMVVGDNNLNVQVANLRRVLGPKAIVTVP